MQHTGPIGQDDEGIAVSIEADRLMLSPGYIETAQGDRVLLLSAPTDCWQLDQDLNAVKAGGKDPVAVKLSVGDFSTLVTNVCLGLGYIPDDISVFLKRGKFIYFEGPHMFEPAKPKVCECGSAKAKLPFHSSWCPLA